jgi:hypothetical protein
MVASVSNPLWLTDKEFYYHTVCQGMLVIVKDWGVELNKGKIIEEYLVQSAFCQGD